LSLASHFFLIKKAKLLAQQGSEQAKGTGKNLLQARKGRHLSRTSKLLSH